MKTMHETLLLVLTMTTFATSGCQRSGADPEDAEMLDTEGARADTGRTTGEGDPQTGDGSTGDGSTGGDEPTDPEEGTTGVEEPDDESSSSGEPEPTGGVDPVDPAEAPEDGDHRDAPGVVVQFRNTAGPPVSVQGPLLDLEEPIDTQGLQYIQEVSSPGDDEDWIEFSIVPGEVDLTIQVQLGCDQDQLDPRPLQADLLGPEGDLLSTLRCGQDPSSITLHDASAFDRYHVVVYTTSEHYEAYTLEIDAFCFQGCDYQPV